MDQGRTTTDRLGDAAGSKGGGEVIDVDLLVEDIRRRAAAMRESGAYPEHLLDAPFDLDTDDPLGAGLASPITLRPERGYSSKPVIGSGITAVKRVAEKLVHHVVQDGLDQASIRIEHLSRVLDDVGRRTEERLDDLSRSLGVAEEHAAGRLGEVRGEIAELRARMDELGDTLERIDRRLIALEGGGASEG
jgi:hypothetical protein